MEPVEINAGEHYLRAFRSDDRVDDVPALAEVLADAEVGRYLKHPSAESFVAQMTDGWAKDERWSWAVCDAVTAEVVAGIVLHDVDHRSGSAQVTCWTRPADRGRGVLPTALNAVLGWAFGAADVHRVVFRHAEPSAAARRVAEKCGFTLEGRLRDSSIIDDQRVDELLWSRLVTDPHPQQLR